MRNRRSSVALGFRFGLVPLASLALSTLLGGVSTQPAFAATVINVKNFGAKGNGTTDDQVAIQNAFNAASQKRATVFFPKGLYLHSGNLDANGIGIDSDRATLIATVATTPTLNLSGRCTVSNLRLQPIVASEDFSFPAITILNSSNKLSNLSVSGFRFPLSSDGTGTTITNCAFTVGNGLSRLAIIGGDRTLISGCTFTGTGQTFEQGVAPQGATNLRITKCTFLNLGIALLFDGNPADTIQFDNNRVIYPIRAIIIQSPVNNLRVNNNEFVGNLSNPPNMAPSAIGISGGQLATRTVIDSNQFKNLLSGVGVSDINELTTSDLVISRNSFRNVEAPIALNFVSQIVIRDNYIANAGVQAIRVGNLSTSLTIARNRNENAGLTPGAHLAVILVDNGSGVVTINNNSYSGNTANLQFFIRSFIPANLTGNTTNTLLPSQVGP